MATILDHVRLLAALLAQADDPVGVATRLSEAALAGAHYDQLRAAVAESVADIGLADTTLKWCGVLDGTGNVTPDAAVVFGQAAALLEVEQSAGYQLVLTVPAFLRPALGQLVAEVGDVARPVETTFALREAAAAAGPRLQIAAPFLHVGFIRLLASDVERVLAGGGQVQLLTRALSLSAPRRSTANTEAVSLLRSVAGGKPGQLTIASWEESGLGVHLKVVLAHRSAGGPVAYIGSSNPTLGGTLAHAEAGVLAHGPQVALLARWLDVIVTGMERRRLLSPPCSG